MMDRALHNEDNYVNTDAPCILSSSICILCILWSDVFLLNVLMRREWIGSLWKISLLMPLDWYQFLLRNLQNDRAWRCLFQGIISRDIIFAWTNKNFSATFIYDKLSKLHSVCYLSTLTIITKQLLHRWRRSPDLCKIISFIIKLDY